MYSKTFGATVSLAQENEILKEAMDFAKAKK
jgi:hypothetical protein